MTGTISSSSTPVLCATLAGVYGLLRLLSWWRAVQKLPPGPKKLPIIDNLLNMPTKLDHEIFAEIARQADSDIIHLGALGQSIVVLSSLKTARELLEKRSGIYSSRPGTIMVPELCGWGWAFALNQYGDKWRDRRRAFQKHMGIDGKIHYPKELYHARRLLNHLIETPDKFFDHLRHMAGAILITSAYGIKVRSEDDPYVRLVEKGARELSTLALEGPFLPDIWPAARHLPSWFPGIEFKKTAAYHKDLSTRVMEVPFKAAQELLKSGDALPSFVSSGLEDIEQKGDHDGADLDRLRSVAGIVYLAGVDTITSSLFVLCLALVKYPRAQKKAQEELDSTLHGHGKFPDHSEILSLPYLTALIMEVLRWKPVTALGVPHAVTDDDVYEGYHIPKGSVVIANQGALLSNEEDFPDPHEFKPERFLKDGKIDEEALSSLDIVFGFGRRICPGRHVALSTLMITAATLLSNFDFSKKKGPDGQTIEPAEGWVEGLARSPIPFQCEITPRSQGAVEAIRAWTAAEDLASF